MRLSAKKQKSWRRSFRECSKLCKGLRNCHATISNVVGGHLLALKVASADDHSEGGGWAGLPEDD